MTDAKIKQIVEQVVPLDPNCEPNRRSQTTLRVRLHDYIRSMVAEYPNLFAAQPYDPRTSTEFDPGLQTK